MNNLRKVKLLTSLKTTLDFLETVLSILKILAILIMIFQAIFLSQQKKNAL